MDDMVVAGFSVVGIQYYFYASYSQNIKNKDFVEGSKDRGIVSLFSFEEPNYPYSCWHGIN